MARASEQVTDTAAIKSDLELLVVHVEKQLEAAKKGRAVDQEKLSAAEQRADQADAKAKTELSRASKLTDKVTELEHELGETKGALQVTATRQSTAYSSKSTCSYSRS